MTTQQAIQHFGGARKLAKALKIKPEAVYQWNNHPPALRQYEIEQLTEGKLKKAA